MHVRLVLLSVLAHQSDAKDRQAMAQDLADCTTGLCLCQTRTV
jgi:hypothetical protein